MDLLLVSKQAEDQMHVCARACVCLKSGLLNTQFLAKKEIAVIHNIDKNKDAKR